MQVLQPIAALLFPTEGRALDRHHSFVVQYQHGDPTSNPKAQPPSRLRHPSTSRLILTLTLTLTLTRTLTLSPSP